ncbi:hypothetical protein [Azohydromonas aeria]|uniref:hypothetical protein n=1 Tax=Azohydromonas aeria TaxID=2590212 RepID=UPI0012F7B6B0|nr:hypothetical protein [Azohydromonas aeria]
MNDSAAWKWSGNKPFAERVRRFQWRKTKAADAGFDGCAFSRQINVAKYPCHGPVHSVFSIRIFMSARLPG